MFTWLSNTADSLQLLQRRHRFYKSQTVSLTLVHEWKNCRLLLWINRGRYALTVHYIVNLCMSTNNVHVSIPPPSPLTHAHKLAWKEDIFLTKTNSCNKIITQVSARLRWQSHWCLLQDLPKCRSATMQFTLPISVVLREIVGWARV